MSDEGIQRLRREAVTDPQAAERLGRHLSRALIPQPRMWLIVRKPGRKAHICRAGIFAFKWRDRLRAVEDIPEEERTPVQRSMLMSLFRSLSDLSPLCGVGGRERQQPKWKRIQQDACMRCTKLHATEPNWRLHLAWGQEIGDPYPDRARAEEVQIALRGVERELSEQGVWRCWTVGELS